MTILLKEEKDGKIWALDPNTGEKLTVIDHPTKGICWNSWDVAYSNLREHEIETKYQGYEIVNSNDPTEKPVIINRASFNPADTAAEDMTIRQVYKCSAMETLLAMDFIHQLADIKPTALANAAASIADAMIAEDRRHEESK